MAEHNTIGSMAPGRYGLAGATGTGTGTGAPLTLQPVPIGVAWNLQGNTRDPAFVQQVLGSFGVAQLPAANRVVNTGLLSVVWLGPTSWLMIAGDPEQTRHPLTGFNGRRDAVNTAGGALFDVSASRVAFKIAGPRAIDVLVSGCPLDLHPRAFLAGSCAQSLFGHVGALYLRDTVGVFTVMVARSFAREVWGELCFSAAQYGYEVLAPVDFS